MTILRVMLLWLLSASLALAQIQQPKTVPVCPSTTQFNTGINQPGVQTVDIYGNACTTASTSPASSVTATQGNKGTAGQAWYVQPGTGATFITLPALITNYGTMSLSATTSTAVTTATAGPNSAAIAFPYPSNVITITNLGNSSNPLYVCPRGGTCSSSVGIRLETGQGRQWNVDSTSSPTPTAATVSCGGTCTVMVEE